MSDRFTEALRHLGHIYETGPELIDISPDEQIRHIQKLYVPTGELKSICGSDSGRGLGCPALWPDSNCESCKNREGITERFVTKRSLMLDLVNVVCDIEQMFLDAMHWNFHNPTERPINPDPDGELAKVWVDYQMQIILMLGRFEPTMKKHEGRFGWPTDFPM